MFLADMNVQQGKEKERSSEHTPPPHLLRARSQAWMFLADMNVQQGKPDAAQELCRMCLRYNKVKCFTSPLS